MDPTGPQLSQLINSCRKFRADIAFFSVMNPSRGMILHGYTSADTGVP